VPLLHNGAPFCRRQPTSSGIPNLLITLQLDAGPLATSSLFPKISLWHPPYEIPHVPLQTSFPLDLPPSFLDLAPSSLEWLPPLFGGPSFFSVGFHFYQHQFLGGDYLGHHFHYLFHFLSMATQFNLRSNAI
jgi:hypothetical protein